MVRRTVVDAQQATTTRNPVRACCRFMRARAKRSIKSTMGGKTRRSPGRAVILRQWARTLYCRKTALVPKGWAAHKN